MTTNQKIEASRELRLWIGQVIVPVITVTSTIMLIPEVRQTVVAKARVAKRFIRNKLHKTEL